LKGTQPDAAMTDARDDQEALDLLDDYLTRLQAGQTPDRQAVLETRPGLAPALDCLEALESLAPEPAAGEGGSDDETLDVQLPVGDLPRTFGQYELLSEIGRGGMGVVYCARQEGLDRTVAVKMILAGHLASPEHVRRFHSEAKAAAKVRHPNVVHIHEVGQLHGQDYFAMDYIEGDSLAERIGKGPVDVSTAVELVGAVARAVEHLHRRGIVHRDLKPSNILLDGSGQPYVTDFGLAKVFGPGSEKTATGVVTGTPSYMSPEQASGRSAEVGPGADIYSLGVILYELLTGRPPFRGENPLDTLMGVLGREPTLPRRLNPRIPHSLELVCLKCLAKSPDDRYASADALADDLERFVRGEALQVRAPHLGQRFLSWTRRQPALASRLGALGLFYVVETVNYLVELVTPDFHWKVSALMGVWAAASVFCQRIIDGRRWDISTRFAWGVLDSICLLAVLLLASGAASPLIVVYPLLIVASGLWFRVRFVWFMTGLSLLSYSVLVVDFYWWRPDLHPPTQAGADRHVIFAVALLLIGSVVSYLVHRVRTLSSFYGREAP